MLVEYLRRVLRILANSMRMAHILQHQHHHHTTHTYTQEQTSRQTYLIKKILQARIPIPLPLPSSLMSIRQKIQHINRLHRFIEHRSIPFRGGYRKPPRRSGNPDPDLAVIMLTVSVVGDIFDNDAFSEVIFIEDCHTLSIDPYDIIRCAGR